MKFIYRILLLSLFASVISCSNEPFVLLFPSFVQPSADGQLLLLLTGMVYKFNDRHIEMDYCPGVNPITCKSYFMDTFMRLGFSHSERVKLDVSRERAYRFLSQKPNEASITLLISTFEREGGFENWKNYGQFILSKDEKPGEITISVNLDENGHFSTLVPVSYSNDDFNIDNGMEKVLKISRKNLVDANSRYSPTFWLKVATRVPDNPHYKLETECPMTLLGTSENEIRIISDVDDTIKLSNVLHGGMELIQKGIFQKYEAIPHMPELFQSIINHGSSSGITSSFHYLSATPWPMAPGYINELILNRNHPFPWGTFTPRSYFPLQRSSSSTSIPGRSGDGSEASSPTALVSLSSQSRGSYREKIWRRLRSRREDPSETGTFRHKMASFERMAQGPAWNRIILIGDSGEYDVDVYRDIVEKRGWYSENENGSIQCVLIRFVAPRDPRNVNEEMNKVMEKIKTLFANIPNWKDHVRIFTDGEELAKMNFMDGNCYTEEDENMWDEFYSAQGSVSQMSFNRLDSIEGLSI